MDIFTSSNIENAFIPWSYYVADQDNQKSEMLIFGKISQHEYSDLISMTSVLSVFRDCFSIKEMLLESKDDIIHYVNKLSSRDIPPDYSIIMPCLISANKFLMDYLSFFKMFIDITSKNVKKIHKEEFDEFQKYSSKLYDDLFGYRFICRLRNYAIHRAMPLKNIEVSRQEGTRITCSKSELLQYDGWSAVKKEILALPNRIDVIPYIEESQTGVIKLYVKFLKIVAQDIFRLKLYLRELYAGFNPESPTIIVTGETIHKLQVETIPVYYLNLFLKEQKRYSMY